MLMKLRKRGKRGCGKGFAGSLKEILILGKARLNKVYAPGRKDEWHLIAVH